MKVAHLDKQAQGSLREQLEAGKQLETDQNYDDAVKLYSAILRKKPLNEAVYNRLMILYRKMKNYKEELTIVNLAISTFLEHSDAGIKKHGSAIQRLSRSIGKSTGLLDPKGKSVFDPEPIATWKKRKTMILKRLKK